MKGTITVEIDDISFEQTERYRDVIHILISNGVLNIRNGRAILNYDSEGSLQEIEINYKKWRKPKSLTQTLSGNKKTFNVQPS